jgi:hypothetical protein
MERGPSTVELTKVKAHATREDIEAGKTTAVHKLGNDRADHGATLGTMAIYEGLLGLSTWMTTRSERYGKFMHKIHCMIVAVLKAEKKERQRRKNLVKMTESKTRKPTMVMAGHLQYPDREQGNTISLKPPPYGEHRYQHHQTLLLQVHRFLCATPFVCINDTGQAGGTWLELYAIFQIMGFQQEITVEGLKEQLARPQNGRDRIRRNKWMKRIGAKRVVQLKRMPAEAKMHTSRRSGLDLFKHIFRYILSILSCHPLHTGEPCHAGY